MAESCLDIRYTVALHATLSWFPGFSTQGHWRWPAYTWLIRNWRPTGSTRTGTLYSQVYNTLWCSHSMFCLVWSVSSVCYVKYCNHHKDWGTSCWRCRPAKANSQVPRDQTWHRGVNSKSCEQHLSNCSTYMACLKTTVMSMDCLSALQLTEAPPHFASQLIRRL